MKTLIYSIFILFTVNSHAQVDSTAESDEIIYHWNIAKYDRYIYYSNRTIGAGCAILGSGILTLLIGETSDAPYPSADLYHCLLAYQLKIIIPIN